MRAHIGNLLQLLCSTAPVRVDVLFDSSMDLQCSVPPLQQQIRVPQIRSENQQMFQRRRQIEMPRFCQKNRCSRLRKKARPGSADQRIAHGKQRRACEPPVVSLVMQIISRRSVAPPSHERRRVQTNCPPSQRHWEVSTKMYSGSKR